MSTERPGGLSPIHGRSTPQDTKAAREERQKVEKVREIDPDEETQRRKRKFQMLMGDETELPDDKKIARSPSPFETEFYNADLPSSDSLGDVKDAIVASPSYSPPPDVSLGASHHEEIAGDLPRSGEFWENANLPDEPIPPQQFKETSLAPSSSAKGHPAVQKEFSPFGLSGKPADQRGTAKRKEPPFGSVPESGMKTSSKPEKHSLSETELKKETKPPLTAKKTEESIFTPSPPQTPFAAQGQAPKGDSEEENETPAGRYLNPEEENFGLKATPPFGARPSKPSETPPPFPKKKEAIAHPSIQEKSQGKNSKSKSTKELIENLTASLPTLPPEVQPIVQEALAQALSYLSSETIPLYFQMVGRMYVMIIPPGISRTELLLNQPLYASSKFFNSRITIEKYATAPDSFNIRLTGSDAAVAAFKENIPSLMTAFQNGNFSFRVNRVDAEYTVERPYFRRKERDEGKGDFGGDFEDRRK